MTELKDLLDKVNYSNIPLFGIPPKDDSFMLSSLYGIERGSSHQVRGLFSKGSRNIKSSLSETFKSAAPQAFALPKPDAHYEESGELHEEALFCDAGAQDVEADKAIPSDVEKLEDILSLAYKSVAKITCINEMPTTRKQVKEVYFLKHGEDWLHKVWVFKADPEQTAKELIVYYIANQKGVQTGKPIGFEPSKEKYQFDIAILGGAVVEHAGNPYSQLISNMRLAPNYMHAAALSVAEMLAQTHIKLTSAKEDFEKYGLILKQASPEKEIENRLLAGLKIEKKHAEKLIRACEDLYKKQSGDLVVSHGDVHLGNIVTKSKDYGMKISTNSFGLIDWESISLDNPYSDLMDFWTHHLRHAENVCESYDFGFTDLESAYQKQAPGFVSNVNDSLIQCALWNLYEMYDPVRTEQQDIEEKAVLHYGNLMNIFKLENLNRGWAEPIRVIKSELKKLLKDEKYLFSKH